MYPNDLFPKIDFLDVNLYGVMIAIGILCCFLVLFIFGKKKGYSENFIDFIFYTAVAAIVLGFFSAALFQAFYNYLENPDKGFKLGSGITFIGGLIGGATTFLAIYYIFRKRLSVSVYDFINFAPPCILIAHAFGRLGCLFVGCCHGEFLGVDKVLGGLYMDGESGWGYYVPTQLYEAIFLFIMFGVTLYLVMKKDFKHNLSLYLIAYGIFRFIIEFARGDSRGEFILNLPPSQFWSIIMVIAGIGLILFIEFVVKKRKKKVSEETIIKDEELPTDTQVNE